MNNTFSFKRFSMLFKKHSMEHGRTYLLSTAVLTGLLFVILYLITYFNNGRISVGDQAGIFVMGFILSGCIFTSSIFANLGNKKKAIPILTLPASHFEKYLVSWIFTLLVFQVLYVGAFYIADSIVLALSTSATTKMLYVFDSEQKLPIVFIAYTLLHALAFWGAIYFEKLHFIKTVFTFFIILLITVIVNRVIVTIFIGSTVLNGLPFLGIELLESGRFFRLAPPDGFIYAHLAVVMLIVLFLWISAFFKLKEKEV